MYGKSFFENVRSSDNPLGKILLPQSPCPSVVHEPLGEGGLSGKRSYPKNAAILAVWEIVGDRCPFSRLVMVSSSHSMIAATSFWRNPRSTRRFRKASPSHVAFQPLTLSCKKAPQQCACGYFGDPKRECRYSPKQVEKTTATGSPARCWIALIFTSSLGPFGERVAEHARRLALQDLPAPLRLTFRPVALDLRTDAQIGFIPSAIPVLLDEIGIGERFPSPPG